MLERTRKLPPKSKPILGWREWLTLPDLGIRRIRAKIDTGARSSSLHVDSLDTFIADGRERVRFAIATGAVGDRSAIVEAAVHDRRPVTDSGGHVSERIFLLTRIELAGQVFAVEINLTSRRDMSFPMLLGRSALRQRFMVDPARSFRAERNVVGGRVAQ